MRKGGCRLGRKKRSTGKSRVGLTLVCLAAASALMYLMGGIKEYRGSPNVQGEIAANRALLLEMQNREPADLDAEAKRLYRETLAAKNGILVDDLEAEQQKILAMTDYNRADLARWFEDTAIVGDSIIRQLRLFEFLDAPVFSKGGIHLSIDLPLLDEVEAAHPKMIFLCFGMNDVGVFKERVDRYVERYCNIIRRLQNSLPEAVIYVHAALPVTEKCVQEDEDYKYLGLYNEEMKKACPTVGAYFIDSGFILEARPELYYPDGRHPREDYYPMWLTYLADLTGLNHE